MSNRTETTRPGNSDPSSSNGCCTNSSEAQTLPTNFLRAQTRPYSEDEDWDKNVLSSSGANFSFIDIPRARNLGLGIGNEIIDICALLAGILSTREKYTKFLSYRGDVAQDVLDLLQKLLDHAPLEPRFHMVIKVALVRLSRKSELYPRCFTVDGVIKKEEYPQSAGNFGDVYQAYHNGQPICLKICRLYQHSDQSLLSKIFYREVIIWGQLFHPNVLPFYGIHRLGDFRNSLCLVSPWISSGNIRDFLSEKPYVDRIPLICDVAGGMEYLHMNGVVHGDLKSTNILVTNFERACLTDFGISYISNNTALMGHALSSNYDPSRASFEAPELIDLDAEYSEKTQASDVYAFGMVCFEILTGERPFGNSGPMLVYQKTVRGEGPSRPTDVKCLEFGLTDDLWALMEKCWSLFPQDRPSATQITRCLPHVKERTTDQWTRFQRPDFDTTSGHADETIAKAFPHLQRLLV
ncbi:hypothetical protein H2248_005679 [Termitomyces sp. 'cryptogamus']|nr:hypothetical protein H2248_005679 [Termitomyces sp. 'cryptogamus']